MIYVHEDYAKCIVYLKSPTAESYALLFKRRSSYEVRLLSKRGRATFVLWQAWSSLMPTIRTSIQCV